jgi:hypothetical protein
VGECPIVQAIFKLKECMYKRKPKKKAIQNCLGMIVFYKKKT